MNIKDKLVYLSDTNSFFKKMKLYYWRCKDYPDQHNVEKMIKKRKRGYIDKKFATIKQMENIHNGERCFIVATGPSLTMEDLQLIKNEISFGMNSITRIYDRAFSSIALAEPTDFDWDALFDGVNWFHWTGINPALSDNMVRICEQACKKAKEKGITISCDLNFRKNLWSSEKAQKVMSNLVQYVDVCIANEEDADKVLGIKAPNNNVESGKLNKSGYEYVAREICKRFGCKKVAITLRESINASRNGWSGMIYDASGVAYYSTHYDIDIVDRVGGGDSFTGAMIYSLITGKDDKDAIEFAVAASCLKHSIEGDFNRVTVSDVENLIKNGGNGRVQR